VRNNFPSPDVEKHLNWHISAWPLNIVIVDVRWDPSSWGVNRKLERIFSRNLWHLST
jgi:hypothetical protein